MGWWGGGGEGDQKFCQKVRYITVERSLPEKSYYNPVKKQKLVTFGSNRKKKKLLSTTEDENEKSYGEIFSRFGNKKLDLRMIMNWPATSKPYSICGENEKTRSSRKSDFRNN